MREPHSRSVYQDPKLSALDQKRNRETETGQIQAAELNFVTPQAPGGAKKGLFVLLSTFTFVVI